MLESKERKKENPSVYIHLSLFPYVHAILPTLLYLLSHVPLLRHVTFRVHSSIQSLLYLSLYWVPFYFLNCVVSTNLLLNNKPVLAFPMINYSTHDLKTTTLSLSLSSCMLVSCKKHLIYSVEWSALGRASSYRHYGKMRFWTRPWVLGLLDLVKISNSHQHEK